jgi:hypothetical protein
MADAPSFVTQAETRCKTPYRTADKDKYYFCVKGPSQKAVSKYSNEYGISPVGIDFLDTPGGFFEFSIELKNFYTNESISCEEFKADFKNSGYAILYTMYWPKKTRSGKHKYRSKNGLRMIGGR